MVYRILYIHSTDSVRLVQSERRKEKRTKRADKNVYLMSNFFLFFILHFQKKTSFFSRFFRFATQQKFLSFPRAEKNRMVKPFMKHKVYYRYFKHSIIMGRDQGKKKRRTKLKFNALFRCLFLIHFIFALCFSSLTRHTP